MSTCVLLMLTVHWLLMPVSLSSLGSGKPCTQRRRRKLYTSERKEERKVGGRVASLLPDKIAKICAGNPRPVFKEIEFIKKLNNARVK